MRNIHIPFLLLLLVGVGLLIINSASLFISLRHPDIYSEKTAFENDITLSEAELWNISRHTYRSRKECIVALNEAVNQGMAHYWGENVKKYNLSLPFYENYLLFAATHLYSFLTKNFPPFRKLFTKFGSPADVLRKYEFSDYKKAIERGVGSCSQHVIVLVQLLKKKRIDAKIIFLKGHVVAMVQVDEEQNEWWVVDPDYGVIIPHDLDIIERQPEIITQYYEEKGYSEQIIKNLVTIYLPDDNKVYNDVSEYHGKDRFYKYYIEYVLYILKWLIPLGLLCPYSLFLIKKKKTIKATQ